VRSVLIGIVLTVAAARPAYADSDGYYCAGSGYLAVEFRSFNGPGTSAPHVLKIVRFDEALGPRWTGEVVVEQFQTHTLTCSADGITFQGAGGLGRGLVSYLVQLDRNGAPRILSHTNDPAHSFDHIPPEPPNLGNWARAGVTPLISAGAAHRFQLRVTETNRRSRSVIRHDMKTVLEEIDQSGRVIRSLLLNKGSRDETID